MQEQGLRRNHGQDGQGRLEARGGAALLVPGEERRGRRVVLAVAAERQERRLGGRARVLGPGDLHHPEQAEEAVGLAERGGVDEEPLRLSLGQLAEVGPGEGEPVERRGRPAVVEPAGREDGAERTALVGRNVDRVVRHRAQGDRRGRLGGSDRAARLAEHARQDAIADRGLVRPPLAAPPFQQRPDAPQRGLLVLVPPEGLQVRRVGLERRPDRLGREREDLLGELEAPPPRERRVGNQGGGAG